MLNIKRRKEGKESGQAMLEFCLVLPLLLLLIALIIEYGWLFYNQIQLENSARNAARVACVEYDKVCCNASANSYDKMVIGSNGNLREENGVTGRTFYLTDYFDQNRNFTGTIAGSGGSDLDLTQEEYDILREVANSLPDVLYNNQYKNNAVDFANRATVTISYTYDNDLDNGTLPDPHFEVKNRRRGDVKVRVKAVYKPISPFVAWGSASQKGSRNRLMTSDSVYKVEKLDNGS